jgi:hypothetical protein
MPLPTRWSWRLSAHLLREIAEDLLLRGQQCAAARRYLERLEQRTAGAVIDIEAV